MDQVLVISFGELILKGKNRGKFQDQANRQIRKALRDFAWEDMYMNMGNLYIVANPMDFPGMIKEIRKVFGIVYVTPAVRVEKDIEKIKEAAKFIVAENCMDKKTFKVRAKRVDKSFEVKSMEMNPMIGEIILRHFPHLSVDVHNPDFELRIDIKDYAYLSVERFEGMGGLPMGSGGRALLLLSGGIDSPVAGFLVARRGVEIAGVHFHSYPFTSERALDKAKRLAEQMSTYVGDMTLYNINLLNTYTQINKNCRPRNTTILARRVMMRICERIAEEEDYQAMVTGESLGQVASQTIQGISVVNEATSLPVLRPCIAMDKSQIIEIAREIGTYEISIEPYDDCCSFFAPERPNIKPRLGDIERDEEKLDLDALVEEALSTLQKVSIRVEG